MLVLRMIQHYAAERLCLGTFYHVTPNRMKRIVGVGLSLLTLILVGGCDNTNAPKQQATEVFIRGAKLVQQITDEATLTAAREEYLTDDVFKDHLPVTIQSVQVEEFEGRQYMTVIAKDKDGLCVSSSRDYTPGITFSKAAEGPDRNWCLNRNCTGCYGIYQNGNFQQCSDCPSTNNPEFPGWCDHYLKD
jgi:hypothetical protein